MTTEEWQRDATELRLPVHHSIEVVRAATRHRCADCGRVRMLVAIRELIDGQETHCSTFLCLTCSGLRKEMRVR